jgi:hypothetical protein
MPLAVLRSLRRADWLRFEDLSVRGQRPTEFQIDLCQCRIDRSARSGAQFEQRVLIL